MIHMFNRKELITVLSSQKLYRLQDALNAAAIPFQVKSSLSPLNSDRYHGTPCINQDALIPRPSMSSLPTMTVPEPPFRQY